MTTIDDLEKLSLNELAQLIKKNYKALLKDRPKMRIMMKLYSKKLDAIKKPVGGYSDELFKLFERGGEKL